MCYLSDNSNKANNVLNKQNFITKYFIFVQFILSNLIWEIKATELITL